MILLMDVYCVAGQNSYHTSYSSNDSNVSQASEVRPPREWESMHFTADGIHAPTLRAEPAGLSASLREV